MNHILTLDEIGAAAIDEILALSERRDLGCPLAGRGVALLFSKPSARTRNSMELAAVQLGAHPVYIQAEEVGLGTRETAEDIARTLACYHGVVAARVSDHRHLVRMAATGAAPVLNMLSDSDHPLQGLADLLTIRQLVGRLAGARIAYVGDGNNNVARSLAQGCALMGADLTIASPEEFQLADPPPGVRQIVNPADAVSGAQVVYTDVWVSMGQDQHTALRNAALAPYQVDEALMALTDDAWFLHCLPARRGEEVTAGVIDGPRSAVWRQAENRLHTARGALAWMVA